MTSDPHSGDSFNSPSDFIPDAVDVESAPSLSTLEAALHLLREIEDPVEKEYQLILQAKQFSLEIQAYRQLSKTYEETKAQQEQEQDLLKHLKLANRTLGEVVQWFENLSLLQLANLIGQFTLLLAVVSYVVEAPKRQREAINNARDIIYERSDQPFSDARVEAFEFLNRHCIPIVGFNIQNASMPGIRLDRCYHWQLNRQSFTQFPPQLRRYEGAILSNLDLQGADLRGAVLTGADFTNANLSQVNLSNAILTSANFQGANLEGAYLNESHLDGAIFKESNLKNAYITRSSLREAVFVHADLTGVHLEWSHLPFAEFAHANLEGANLSRADLKNADFYKANLKNTRLRHADLREQTNLREAIVAQADLRSARFASVNQLQRTIGWEDALKDPKWRNTIAAPQVTPKIGLVVSSSGSIFNSYRLGMQSINEAEIVTSLVRRSDESAAIQTLIDSNVQAIVLRPNDPEDSVPAIQAAYEQGIAVITIGECVNLKDAERYVFGCYESNSFQIGYESSALMVQDLQQRQPGAIMKIAVLDGSGSGRLYPYFQGFQQALRDSGKPWEEVASSDASTPSDKDKIWNLVQSHPDIQAIWSASNGTTEVAVDVVQQLNRWNEIMVFGILDLTPAKSQMLLDPENPLHSIVDQNPLLTGKLATQRALEVLAGESLGYRYEMIPHQVLNQNDREAIETALEDMRSFEQNLN